MQVLLGRKPRLEDWQSRPFAAGVDRGPLPGSRRDCWERVVGREPGGRPQPDGLHYRLAAHVMRYDIFPPGLGSPVLLSSPLQVGDTVGLHFHLLPGVGLFFASRVVDAFDVLRDGTWHTGFTYRTLQGHPELGEETFSVEKNLDTGEVMVALRSWSQPGMWVTRWFDFLTRAFQVKASRGALDHLQQCARAPG